MAAKTVEGNSETCLSSKSSFSYSQFSCNLSFRALLFHRHHHQGNTDLHSFLRGFSRSRYCYLGRLKVEGEPRLEALAMRGGGGARTPASGKRGKMGTLLSAVTAMRAEAASAEAASADSSGPGRLARSASVRAAAAAAAEHQQEQRGFPFSESRLIGMFALCLGRFHPGEPWAASFKFVGFPPYSSSS